MILIWSIANKTDSFYFVSQSWYNGVVLIRTLGRSL